MTRGKHAANVARKDLGPRSDMTPQTEYLLGRRKLVRIIPYLCCVHCVHWDMDGKNANDHLTPCQHVDFLGHKNCVSGQIPAGE